jgi:phage gp16-like protein
MFGKDVEHWLDLCELAAKELDPTKQRAILQDIACILNAKTGPHEECPTVKKIKHFFS